MPPKKSTSNTPHPSSASSVFLIMEGALVDPTAIAAISGAPGMTQGAHTEAAPDSTRASQGLRAQAAAPAEMVGLAKGCADAGGNGDVDDCDEDVEGEGDGWPTEHPPHLLETRASTPDGAPLVLWYAGSHSGAMPLSGLSFGTAPFVFTRTKDQALGLIANNGEGECEGGHVPKPAHLVFKKPACLQDLADAAADLSLPFSFKDPLSVLGISQAVVRQLQRLGHDAIIIRQGRRSTPLYIVFSAAQIIGLEGHALECALALLNESAPPVTRARKVKAKPMAMA